MEHKNRQKLFKARQRPPRDDSRGTIVVDSNMLDEMATRLPRKRLHLIPDSPIATLLPSSNSYLDLLPVLASQGYHIIIPETVMLEMAQMLNNGQDLKELFPDSRSIYPNEEKVREFFRNIIKGKFPNMEVVEASTSERQNYQKYIYDLLNAFGQVNLHRTHDAIVQIQSEQRTAKHDMGENHCFDVIDAELARQRQTSERKPIFFLSADKKARIALRHRCEQNHQDNDPPVNVLTSGGIYLGLGTDAIALPSGKSTALNQIGLPGTAIDHWKHIYDSNNKKDQKIPSTPSAKNGYEDSPVTEYDTGEFPFKESARGIAAALAEKQKKTALGAHTAAHPAASPFDKIAGDITGTGPVTFSGR